MHYLSPCFLPGRYKFPKRSWSGPPGLGMMHLFSTFRTPGGWRKTTLENQHPIFCCRHGKRAIWNGSHNPRVLTTYPNWDSASKNGATRMLRVRSKFAWCIRPLSQLAQQHQSHEGHDNAQIPRIMMTMMMMMMMVMMMMMMMCAQPTHPPKKSGFISGSLEMVNNVYILYI